MLLQCLFDMKYTERQQILKRPILTDSRWETTYLHSLRGHSEFLSSLLSLNLSRERNSSVSQIPVPKGGSSIQRLDHTNHHVDVLWFQATKKFSSQTDPFKVHKNSPKNFKSILRNHLEQESTKLLVS